MSFFKKTHEESAASDESRLDEVERNLRSALDESRQRSAETAALLAASRAMLEYQEFKDAARSLFDYCKDLIGATSGYVALLSENGIENEVLFLDAGGMPCTVDPSLPMPIRGLRAEAYRTSKPAIENDFAGSEWAKFMPDGHSRLDNVLFAPLMVNGKAAGLLGIANKPGGFNDRDAKLAAAFGELLSVSLQNDRMLESLEKSEERFRSVTQSANDAIVSADSQGNIISWNMGAQNLFGYSEDEALGQPVTMLMAEHYREIHRNGMERFLRTGEPRVMGNTVELNGRTKGGAEFPIELSLSSWKTKDGTFFASIIRDITAREQVQRDLLESENRLRTIFEQSPVPIWEEDYSRVRQRLDELRKAGVEDFREYLEEHPDEARSLAEAVKVIDVNQESVNFFEVGSKEEMPVNLANLYLDQSWGPFCERIVALSQGTTRFESEITLKTMTGRHKIVLLRLSVEPGYEKSLSRVLVSFVDITDRMQSQELSNSLNNINTLINSTRDMFEIVGIVAREAATTLAVESARIILREDGRWTVRYAHNLPEELVGDAISGDEAEMLMMAVESGKPVTVMDDDVKFRAVMAAGGVRSSLLVPLKLREDALGVMTFSQHSLARSFSENQMDFARKLANSVSLAIENAGLYQKELATRSEVQNHAAQLSILHKISLSLNRETDQNRLLKMILKSAADITSAGVGIMALVKEGKTDVISVYYAPWYEQRCDIGNEAPMLHKRIARFIEGSERDGVRISDTGGLNDFPEGHLDLRGLLIGTIRDTRGRVRGSFMLSDKAAGENFTPEDEEIITLLAAQSSVALVSAENFEREHSIAETLQSTLLPEVPIRDDVEVGLLYKSAGPVGKVGGDFYDFVELHDNRMAVAVGDVCGKGLEAATYTAMIKFMLRAYLGEGMLPGDCLTRLNRAISKQIPIERFVTVSLAIIDTASASITFSSAGHPPLFICRNGKANQLKAAQSIPLGVIPDYKYLSTQATTAGACSILMYTDGLIEARPDGGDPFGESRIVETLAGQCCEPAQKVADSLVQAAVDYSGGALRDDIALLVVRMIKNTSEI
ncbi:MAG: SpoIIE family protein phosphatase [Thermoleophilia bacterium]|jgi:PAS domain S-box-containing protein